MRGVSIQQVETARKIGILEYIQTFEPDELIRVSLHEFRTKTHSSLVISDNGLFHWYKEAIGGNNAIDYLLKVQKMDFISAVRLLNEVQPRISSFQPVQYEPKKESVPIFAVPKKDAGNEAVISYLKRRGICKHIINYCIGNGLLYQTTRAGHKNCVFVGYDNSNNAKSAFIRSCQGTWRGDACGSQKKYGFYISSDRSDCTRLEIYEAPIDALSGASLRYLSNKSAWLSTNYLAMGGLNNSSVDYYLEHHPNIKSIRLCLDNDAAGHNFARSLYERLSQKGYRTIISPPSIGKDYNDLLLSCKYKAAPTR